MVGANASRLISRITLIDIDRNAFGLGNDILVLL